VSIYIAQQNLNAVSISFFCIINILKKSMFSAVTTGFLELKNLPKDYKIISLVHFLQELWMMLWYGGHLGHHLEFHPFCLWSTLSTQVFLLT